MTDTDARPDAPKKMSRLWAHERREQLVRVTAELVAREGAGGVRVPDVAQAAGVTRPVVYRFFPNRDALLVAVLEDFTEALAARFRERLESTPFAGTTRDAERFRHTVRTFVEVVFDVIDERSAGGWYLFGTEAPLPEVETAIRDARTRLVRPWHRTICRVMGVSSIEAETIAAMLVAISRAIVQRWIEGAIDRETALDALMRGTSALISEFTVATTRTASAAR